MSDKPERFWYPFTATTVLARTLVPLLLFTLGTGLWLWAGREFYFWRRPWAVLPEALLALLAWLVAGYFFTLLPEVRASASGLQVRRWGVLWRRIPWPAIAGVEKTAQVDLMGWAESFYTVYTWQAVSGRRGHVRRDWHRKKGRAFRFSGHIRNCERLVAMIEEQAAARASESDSGVRSGAD